MLGTPGCIISTTEIWFWLAEASFAFCCADDTCCFWPSRPQHERGGWKKERE